MYQNCKRRCLAISCFVFLCLQTCGFILYFSINIREKIKDFIYQTEIPNKNTNTSPSSKTNCVPFIVPDTRPFFEREPIQSNLPRRLENLSDKDLYRKLASLKLLVFSTARNVERNIDTFRKHIDPIVDLFHSSSRILICESDSDDKTLEKLQQWPRAQVYSFSQLSKTYSMRTERIAFCRNTLMNLTYEIESDYILHVDLDIFRTDISSFISNFRYHTDDWAVMTASTRHSYYDIWALRTLSDSVMNYDVWHEVWKILRDKKKYCAKSVTDKIIRIHQKHIPIERGLIEVRSAFNAAGLYRTKMTYGCRYSGEDTTCEHVSFHLCIRDIHRGRIFINPEFTCD